MILRNRFGPTIMRITLTLPTLFLLILTTGSRKEVETDLVAVVGSLQVGRDNLTLNDQDVSLGELRAKLNSEAKGVTYLLEVNIQDDVEMRVVSVVRSTIADAGVDGVSFGGGLYVERRFFSPEK